MEEYSSYQPEPTIPEKPNVFAKEKNSIIELITNNIGKQAYISVFKRNTDFNYDYRAQDYEVKLTRTHIRMAQSGTITAAQLL